MVDRGHVVVSHECDTCACLVVGIHLNLIKHSKDFRHVPRSDGLCRKRTYLYDYLGWLMSGLSPPLSQASYGSLNEIIEYIRRVGVSFRGMIYRGFKVEGYDRQILREMRLACNFIDLSDRLLGATATDLCCYISILSPSAARPHRIHIGTLIWYHLCWTQGKRAAAKRLRATYSVQRLETWLETRLEKVSSDGAVLCQPPWKSYSTIRARPIPAGRLF